MEPRVTETDLAMLLLGEDDLMALGAVLGLRAQGVELQVAAPEEWGLAASTPSP